MITSEDFNRIPVITLWQPWASWIALGWKTTETRTHNRLASLLGRRVFIHAGDKWDNQALYLAANFLSRHQRATTMDHYGVFGKILCSAVVTEHRALTVLDSPPALIDCGTTKRYGLFLSELQVIIPIPAKGRQGIWYYNLQGEQRHG